MALGAGQPQMMRLLLTQGFKLTVIGIVLGLLIAFGLTRVLASRYLE